MIKFLGLSLTILILYGIKSIKTEIFTSIADVEELFETESVLINNLEEYLLFQEINLNNAKLKVEEYKKQHQVGMKDVTLYVSNPINAFLLIKRLTFDWRYLEEDLMSHDNGGSLLENITNYRNTLKLPSEEDLIGAAVALLRLQDTYNLETAIVARGELNGVQYSTEMTSSDCLTLGIESYVSGNAYYMVSWMDEAIKRFVSESKNEIDSNTEETLKMLFELRNAVPNYQHNISENSSETVGEHSEYNDFQFLDSEIYKKMCREELKPTPSQLRPLRCHYVTNNVPFLKIAPLKRETASISPLIVIYHDVVYDNEIELVKKLAKPQLRRATIGNLYTGYTQATTIRIAKSAWITEEDKIIQNIVQRTEDMTGLDMEAAESLQIVNYGIGGQYEPHFDAMEEDENVCNPFYKDDRIATVLFYLSDVEQGGATVFPAVHTSIFPIKGAAVFWYNLYPSGNLDYRTRHAACPVLIGTKWVANKWIHECGQEFRRQCNLMPDDPNLEGENLTALYRSFLN